jgi:glycosyltransferase involved in cell wall biosynthesis
VPVLLFAGRIDPGKSVMTLAAAAAQLRRDGRPIHVIAAGSGSEAPSIHALLGPHATLPGTVDPATLAWLYASADLFVFPSRIEVLPNVVLEAKASGVPVVVAPEGGGVHVRTPGVDGVVVADPAPAAWAAAIAALLDDGDRRASLAAAGRADVERNHPSWEDVLSDDLAPVWRTVARGKHAEPVDVGRSDPASRPASR